MEGLTQIISERAGHDYMYCELLILIESQMVTYFIVHG